MLLKRWINISLQKHAMTNLTTHIHFDLSELLYEDEEDITMPLFINCLVIDP